MSSTGASAPIPTRSSLRPEEIHYIVAGSGGGSLQDDLVCQWSWNLSIEQYVLIGTLLQLGQGVQLEACKNMERKTGGPIVHVSGLPELDDATFIKIVAATDVPEEQQLEQSEMDEMEQELNRGIRNLLTLMRRQDGPPPILCCSN